MSLFARVTPFLLVPLFAALAACSSPKPKFQDDQLLSSAAGSSYSHGFNFSGTDACEAARRALLSQGYMATMTRADTIDASKNFQPASDSHIVVEVHVVCMDGDTANSSIIYANAVQNGYALKKSDTSASVGLSIFGSLSLPIRQNNDAMVEISSETIQSDVFYKRLFDLIDQYLHTVTRSEPVPAGSVQVTPLPAPKEAAAPGAASAPAAAEPAGGGSGAAQALLPPPATVRTTTPAVAAPGTLAGPMPTSVSAAQATATVAASHSAPAPQPVVGPPAADSASAPAQTGSAAQPAQTQPPPELSPEQLLDGADAPAATAPASAPTAVP